MGEENCSTEVLILNIVLCELLGGLLRITQLFWQGKIAFSKNLQVLTLKMFTELC